MRGFQNVTGYDVPLPKRATSHSAGYDICTTEDALLEAGDTVVLKTGLKAYMGADEVLLIFIRSSIGIKHDITLSNGTGVIDSDYYNNEDNEGHIHIALTNCGYNDFLITKGDRLAQGVFVKYLITDDDTASGVRSGGIGSTGK